MLKRHVWNKNTGYSMIELIIVIAILAILSSGTFYTLNYIKYANTLKCAKEINFMIDKVKLEAMSKIDKPDLYIYKFGDNYYMKASSIIPTLDETGIKIGGHGIDIYYQGSGETSDSLLDASKIIRMGFSRSTGAFLNNGSPASPGTITDPVFYNKIIIKGRKTHTITMYETTGKHEID